MMDSATLDAFARFIVEASESSYETISQLTVEEGRAYQRVKTGNLLLEQEKIPHFHAASLATQNC